MDTSNIIETVKNIKLKKKISGGVKVNESDGFCATLPYFLYGFDFKSLEKIFKIVTVSKISFKYALAKFYLIDFALKGAKDPIKEFIKKFNRNSFFKGIVNDIKKIRKFGSKFDLTVIKKLGMACSYPGTFNSSIHAILNSSNYKKAILKTIKAGGCNCSRANFIGAYFVAKKGLSSIPVSWIKQTHLAKKILKQN